MYCIAKLNWHRMQHVLFSKKYKCSSVVGTYIHQRSRLPILPRGMALSAMSPNLGADHIRKANVKQMRPWFSRTAPFFTRVCLHIYTAVHVGNIRTWRTTIILITGKTLKTPKLSPMQGSRWRRFWYLWCISVVVRCLIVTCNILRFANPVNTLHISCSTHVQLEIFFFFEGDAW